MSTEAGTQCSKTSSGPRGRSAGPRLQTVSVPRPRCPSCNGVRLKKYRSLSDQGDGSALWWVKCAECEERFRVLLE